MQEYLQPTYYVDSNSPIVFEIAINLTEKIQNLIEKAKSIYYWTRDEILYDPYDSFFASRRRYKASRTIKAKTGWCVQKACVLSALARAIDIPARLHFADIRNYASSEKLKQLMGTDIFYYHGYSELFLNEKWVKATPAFNLSLCENLGWKPVEFDGVNDAILPETTLNGKKHVEYLKDRGTSPDFPFKEIFAFFDTVYPFGDKKPEPNKVK